jgi:hypothetical protein
VSSQVSICTSGFHADRTILSASQYGACNSYLFNVTSSTLSAPARKKKVLSHAIAATEVCALGTVFLHKPFLCDYLIFEPDNGMTRVESVFDLFCMRGRLTLWRFARRAYIASEGFVCTIVASRAKVRQMRSGQLAIARPISSGLSSCTKWRPLATTRC